MAAWPWLPCWAISRRRVRMTHRGEHSGERSHMHRLMFVCPTGCGDPASEVFHVRGKAWGPQEKKLTSADCGPCVELTQPALRAILRARTLAPHDIGGIGWPSQRGPGCLQSC
ncbi:hypothetical protein HaLaN_11084 [Haematococcus lacustris]|uniref:Uncharacterized protein n=1 Tax=Haematococcus lacustris TaxID=44745 RepID=A0A699YZ25_HAELA|nr:hypothetical protein HaLaN_11084 [Haematococcus lacustris]